MVVADFMHIPVPSTLRRRAFTVHRRYIGAFLQHIRVHSAHTHVPPRRIPRVNGAHRSTNAAQTPVKTAYCYSPEALTGRNGIFSREQRHWIPDRSPPSRTETFRDRLYDIVPLRGTGGRIVMRPYIGCIAYRKGKCLFHASESSRGGRYGNDGCRKSRPRINGKSALGELSKFP